MSGELGKETEQLLALSDADRRRYVGRAFNAMLTERGLSGMFYQGNIEEALPEAVRPALTAHGAPPSAYQGRMVGMSLSILPQKAPRVLLEEPLFPAENAFWNKLAKDLDVPMPEVTTDASNLNLDGLFIYPFIGSGSYNKRYPGRTIPAAGTFNNKAHMRQVLKEAGLEKALVPGSEVVYEGEQVKKYVERCVRSVEQQMEHAGRPLMVKLANTASGLLNVQVHPDILRSANGRERLENAFRQMFLSPFDGKYYPGDVVLEEFVDFGASSDGYGDFSVRGYTTPKGQFVPVSAGRVISDRSGEYLGMVMTRVDRQGELDTIGLDPKVLRKELSVMQAWSNELRDRGYFGPISLDFFAEQQKPDGQILNHDYNVREGGTTISGLISSVARQALGSEAPVLDIELKAKMDERTIDQALEDLQAEGVFPYATTFLKYPNKEGVRTMKVVTRYTGSAQTDRHVREAITDLTSLLNIRLSRRGVSFNMPQNL